MRMVFPKKVKHRPAEELKPQMCYLQYNMWLIQLGCAGVHNNDMTINQQDYSKIPMYFAYGIEKPFMYHRTDWLRNLMKIEKEHPERVRVQHFHSNHWVPIFAAKEYTESLINWLNDTATKK